MFPSLVTDVNICIRISKPCIDGALKSYIIQADDVCRSEKLFLDRAERHSLEGVGVPSSMIPP